MKAVVVAFNQEKALVGAFSVITNLRMELFEALVITDYGPRPGGQLLSGTAMSEDPNKVTGDNIISGNTGRRSWSQNVKQNNE